MLDLDEGFTQADPFELAKSWLKEAEAAEINDPNAMALASVDRFGMPNVRTVLLKDIQANSFVFYTNYESAKGTELLASGKAAFVLHWKSLARQIRVRGLVEKEEGPIADAYYNSRALDSRIGAWASQQSRPLASREALIQRVNEIRDEKGENPARPPFWGGFRITPLEIEFWSDGAFRLHDRAVWRRKEVTAPWSVHRLNP